MFWNDIKEMREWMNRLTDRLVRIDHNVEKALGHIQESEAKAYCRDDIEDCLIDLKDAFCPDDEYSSMNRMHDKLDFLVEDIDRERSILLAQKTLDKFEDYMRNVDKINSMINEFKGCVSLARGALEERKELDKQMAATAKLAHISQEIYNSMLNFIKAGDTMEKAKFFKIDAIYDAVCHKEEKKTPRKRKPIKKKVVVVAAPVSE